MKNLTAANDVRLRMDRPLLSKFRVAAAVEYEDALGARALKVGFNTEPCSVGGSICAERSALSDLEDARKILGVYIVSDSRAPITPGMLCREYMSTRFPASVVDPRTFRVVLAGTEGGDVLWDTVIDTTLLSLYPAVTPRGRRQGLTVCMPCEGGEDAGLCGAAVDEAKKEVRSGQGANGTRSKRHMETARGANDARREATKHCEYSAFSSLRSSLILPYNSSLVTRFARR